MYPPPEPPFFFYLGVLPLYGLPLFVLVWTVCIWRAGRGRARAIKGLAAGLAGWVALTIGFFVAGWMLEPCLENCSQFRTPAGNRRMFALILGYTVLAAGIAFGLYRYGRKTQEAT
jgi:hypothetical protein